jgi:hypothetical protein
LLSNPDISQRNGFWGEGLWKGGKSGAEVVVLEKLGAVGGPKMFLCCF